MNLEKLKLLNFRNLEKIELDVSARINIFLGRNGQGKTNLLEGLSYLALGRSHRGSLDRDLIHFGANHLHLSVEGSSDRDDPFRLEAALTGEGKKQIKVDGHVAHRRADLVGRLSVVQFDPDEVDLTKGSPEHRRRYLDYTLSVGSSLYLRHLLQYRRAVAQKNRLLKQRHAASAAELDAWDQELVEHGVRLVRERQEILPELERVATESNEALAPGGGHLRLRIESTLDNGESADSEEGVKERFQEALRRERRNEMRVGHGLVGPHRDRLEVYLEEKSIRRFGSQGEMRSASIALKLAQAEVIYRHTDERPVVFLDDIFSELDRRRTEALQERLHQEHQLFIATARLDDVLPMADWSSLSVWYVNDGKVTQLGNLREARPLMGTAAEAEGNS